MAVATSMSFQRHSNEYSAASNDLAYQYHSGLQKQAKLPKLEQMMRSRKHDLSLSWAGFIHIST